MEWSKYGDRFNSLLGKYDIPQRTSYYSSLTSPEISEASTPFGFDSGRALGGVAGAALAGAGGFGLSKLLNRKADKFLTSGKFDDPDAQKSIEKLRGLGWDEKDYVEKMKKQFFADRKKAVPKAQVASWNKTWNSKKGIFKKGAPQIAKKDYIQQMTEKFRSAKPGQKETLKWSKMYGKEFEKGMKGIDKLPWLKGRAKVKGSLLLKKYGKTLGPLAGALVAGNLVKNLAQQSSQRPSWERQAEAQMRFDNEDILL